jgi:DinB family protein
MTTDYTALTLSAVPSELGAIAREVEADFGALDGAQLNWRSDDASWSVAQCFDHLLNANREMWQAIDSALDRERAPSLAQRLPLLPGLFGRVLIRSQMPESTRRFTAPRAAAPSARAIDARVVERFIASQREAATRVASLGAEDAARIMVSPFVALIAYSVLDGVRLIVAHERRHVEQARRVTRQAAFPGRS